jgi:hypothetical protein
MTDFLHILSDYFTQSWINNRNSAIDPYWKMLPSPEELQDNATFTEIQGHLSRIRFFFEAYTACPPNLAIERLIPSSKTNLLRISQAARKAPPR